MAAPVLVAALAQSGDTSRRQRTTADRVNAIMQPGSKKPGVLTNRTDPPLERVQDALSHIRTALVNVKQDRGVATDLWRILPGQDQQEAFFLAMAMKESKVHPNPPLPPSAPKGAKQDSVGYFQVRETAVKEVNRIFSTSLQKTYIHQNIPTTPVAGSEAGILYFVLAVRQASDSFPAVTDPSERLKLSLVMYNGGQGNVEALMRKAPVTPTRYESLYEYLNALALSGAPPDVRTRIATQRAHAGLGKTQLYREIAITPDATYPVSYRAGDGIEAYLQNKEFYDAQAQAKIIIPDLHNRDGKEFKGGIPYWKPAVIGRYAELIPEMARKILEEELSQIGIKR